MDQQSGDASQEEEKSLHVPEVQGLPQEATTQAERIEKLLEAAEASKGQGFLPPIGDSPSVQFAKAIEAQFIQSEKKSLEEDARLDYLLRMQKTLNEKFDNGGWIHPHGTSDFDHCIIPECRQSQVEKFKMNIRRQNYTYLNQHPELDALMSIFIKRLLKSQPRNAVRFAAEFFTYRRVAPQDLQRLVADEMSKLKQFHNPNDWKTSSHGSMTSNALTHVNEVTKLSLGPVSQAFGYTSPETLEKSRPVKMKKKVKSKPKPHVYCGCKDPGRRKYENPGVEAQSPGKKLLEACIGLPSHQKY